MSVKKMLALPACILIVLVGFISGCSQEAFNPPPSLPPVYYTAIESNPQELVYAYFYSGFADYIDIREPKARYNGKFFVFNNVLVDDWVIRDVDKGWIWLDLIKCPLVNTTEMKKFALGDRIEVVGLNLGPEDDHKPGLIFKDCYVLPQGAVQLPVGDSPAIVPAY